MKEIALHGAAAGLFKVARLGLRLDAFRNQIQAQAAGDPDDGQHHWKMTVLMLFFLDKRLVDFYRLNREPVQGGQRGVAGTKVIHRNADAELAKLVELIDRMLRI